MIKKLEELVSSGSLKSYSFRTLDMDGLEIEAGTTNGRETEEITLVFPNGQTLVIGTFCSGCAENTCFIFG